MTSERLTLNSSLHRKWAKEMSETLAVWLEERFDTLTEDTIVGELEKELNSNLKEFEEYITFLSMRY
jgi:hypothetical protein